MSRRRRRQRDPARVQAGKARIATRRRLDSEKRDRAARLLEWLAWVSIPELAANRLRPDAFGYVFLERESGGNR